LREVWYYAREGKPAGPVDRAEIESLLRQGVIQPETLVWREGTPDWVMARAAFPEISGGAAAEGPSASALGAAPLEASLDVGECVKEAWQAFRAHWVVLMGGWLIALVIIPLLVSIPFVIADFALGGFPPQGRVPEMNLARLGVNLASSLVSVVVNTPLQAGFLLLALQALRSQPNLAVIFQPFRTCWLALVLAQLSVFAVSVAVIGVPAGGFFWGVVSRNWVVAAVLGVVLVAVAIYVSLCWLFVTPLVADAGRSPIAAMRASVRLVQANLLPIFALAVVGLAINLIGLLCCLVGLLVTLPFTSVVLMAAYRRLVSTLG
jgi:hypothetical protein